VGGEGQSRQEVSAARADELTRLLRKLTPAQRKVLRALPQNNFQLWGTAIKLGHNRASVFRWLRKPEFVAARALYEQRAFDEADITNGYILKRTKDVVERAMQAEPVLDSEGNETGVYRFEGNTALKGLDMLGKHKRLWADEAAKPATVEGPGLTVIVQQGGAQVGVHAQAGAAGRVVVDLPGPE
jgi:hypothetical protein